MDMNNVNIEEIVKQVLAGMAGTAPAASASAAPATPAAAPAGAIPKTAHVAVLTEKEHFDIKEYPIPAIGMRELVRSLLWVKMLRLIQLENRLRSVTKLLPV